MAIKPEIKYGAICAAGLIIWTMIQYWLGFHTIRLYIGQYSGYGMYAIIFACLWLGLKDKFSDDLSKLSVRQGVREAVLQLMITASISSVFMFIYDYRINPFWVDNMIQYQRENPSALKTFVKFANDPDASAIVLSNTETHLCLYFLSILAVGSAMGFMISASTLNSRKRGN